MADLVESRASTAAVTEKEGLKVRRWHDTPPHLRWASAALVPFTVSGYSKATMLAAAAGISLLMLVLLIAVVALGASFSRSPARRRACMQALEALIRLAPWTNKR